MRVKNWEIWSCARTYILYLLRAHYGFDFPKLRGKVSPELRTFILIKKLYTLHFKPTESRSRVILYEQSVGKIKLSASCKRSILDETRHYVHNLRLRISRKKFLPRFFKTQKKSFTRASNFFLRKKFSVRFLNSFCIIIHTSTGVNRCFQWIWNICRQCPIA